MADFDATLIGTHDLYYGEPLDPLGDFEGRPIDKDDYYGESLDPLADYGATLVDPAGGGGPAVVYYDMRAWNTNLTKYVYWRSSGAPDFTGASSGYPPGDLTLIIVQAASRA